MEIGEADKFRLEDDGVIHNVALPAQHIPAHWETSSWSAKPREVEFTYLGDRLIKTETISEGHWAGSKTVWVEARDYPADNDESRLVTRSFTHKFSCSFSLSVLT